jgi:hypothetical protein
MNSTKNTKKKTTAGATPQKAAPTATHQQIETACIA